MHTRTATVLLEGLGDPANAAVWSEFDGRFRPVLIGLARRLGLSEVDAADVAQEALARFVAAYRGGAYDRDRGRLSSWLMGIARNCVLDLKRRRAVAAEARGVSAIGELPDAFRMSVIWEEECQRSLLTEALAELRRSPRLEKKTLRAFEMLAFDGRSPAEVSETLGMSLNSIYLAKNRCLSRLRQIMQVLGESDGEGRGDC